MKAAAALALYAGLAVVLSWPLAAHLGTHLPNTWPPGDSRACTIGPPGVIVAASG